MGLRVSLTTKLLKATFDRRFTMAKLTRVPGLGWGMEKALFDRDDMFYLPRDGTVQAGRVRSIELGVEVRPESVMLPSQVIDHFLRRSRHIVIMNACMCRDANECEDYPHELGCIFLGRGAARIPPELGRPATADEAVEHMRKAREKGLVHLIGRNKIDSVWLNTGPKEELLSICNCCPCCCLWKMLPQLSEGIASGVTRMPGVEVQVTDRCIGCGRCVEERWCFLGAISLRDGRAMIDEHLCKGCGRCAEHCPSRAVEVSITDPAFMEKAIGRIEPLVDVTAR